MDHAAYYCRIYLIIVRIVPVRMIERLSPDGAELALSGFEAERINQQMQEEQIEFYDLHVAWFDKVLTFS